MIVPRVRDFSDTEDRHITQRTRPGVIGVTTEAQSNATSTHTAEVTIHMDTEPLTTTSEEQPETDFFNPSLPCPEHVQT